MPPRFLYKYASHPHGRGVRGSFLPGHTIISLSSMAPQRILESCLLHSAMIIASSYFLRLETRGDDILEDISDFWHSSLRNDLQERSVIKFVDPNWSIISPVAVYKRYL
jgi:hypothetical protein